MLAGFAERDITPRIGQESPCHYYRVYHTRFHDSCKARIAVVGADESAVALIALDAPYLPRHFVESVRSGIAACTGLAPGAVCISASHYHSAGPMGFLTPGIFEDGDDTVRWLGLEESPVADAEYVARVTQACIKGAEEAWLGRVESRGVAGLGHENRVAFNRRFRMRGGLSATHPGQGNPDIMEPAGPIDPEVGVVGFFDADERLLGCIVNYACHGTTGPGGTSADWIYYLERTVRGVMGEQATVVFLNGACGDVTQVDNRSPYQHPPGDVWARRVGGCVGAEALKVLHLGWPGELGPVTFASKTLTIPRRPPSAARVAQARETVRRADLEKRHPEWLFAKETVLLEHLIRKEPVLNVELQAIQIGPVVFLANPAEYFCQFGLDLKKESDFPFTFPVELANGTAGYVPTREAMSDSGGGYETRLTTYSNLVVGAGEKIRDGLQELAAGLTPGPVPTPPPAPPYRQKPWGLGAARPELE